MVATSRQANCPSPVGLLETAGLKWRWFWPILATLLLTFSIDNISVILSLPDSQSQCPSRRPTVQPRPRPHLKLPPDLMNGKQIYEYLRWTNSESCQFSVDFGRYYVFLENQKDQTEPDGPKPVCFDDNVSPVFNDCLVYSFGLSDQWSFLDSMNEFSCQIYAFDPTKKIKFKELNQQRVFFYEWGLDGQDRIHPTKNWTMKTASSIYGMLEEKHGSKMVDVIKMDADFAEWDAIPQMVKSGFLADKVKQLTVELHFQANDTLKTFRERIAILQDLENDSVSSDGRIGRFVRYTSRHNPGLKRPIKILNNKPDYVTFEIAWFNSRFYNHSAN